MVKAQELRRGNKVISKTHNILNATFEGCTPHNLVFLKEVSTYEVLDNLEPIILTPEILENAGFVTLKHSGEYWLHFKNKNGWYISQWIAQEQMAGFEEQGVFYYSDNYIPVKYLHELQNLYFALTRTELEINL